MFSKIIAGLNETIKLSCSGCRTCQTCTDATMNSTEHAPSMLLPVAATCEGTDAYGCLELEQNQYTVGLTAAAIIHSMQKSR